MVVYFSDSLILFPISSIDTFLYSNLRVVYFRMMRPSSSRSGVSIIIIFTPDPLGLGFKIMRRMALSLIFSLLEVRGVLILTLGYLWLTYICLLFSGG